jgi:hypothetical protein
MNHCANCGTALHGAYCSQCGQSADEGHAPTLGHFFHEVTHEFIHVDGKIGRSAKALLTSPGLLTKEYWSGHIVDWVRPIRLFLIVAAIHLLVSPGIGPFNLQLILYRNANGQLHLSASPTPQADMKRNSREVLPEKERVEALEQFEKAYHSIRYFSPIMYAFASWILYRRRQPYFVNHLVGGLHFYAFWYALAIVVGLLSRLQENFAFLGILSAIYLYLSLKRLFGERWLVTAFKTALMYGYLFFIELFLALIGMSTVMARMR